MADAHRLISHANALVNNTGVDRAYDVPVPHPSRRRYFAGRLGEAFIS
jgi:hypothetical protein